VQVQSYLPGGANVPARRHSAVSCAKTAEPIDLPFGCGLGWTEEAQVQSYSPGGANVLSWEGTMAPPGECDSIIRLQRLCSLMSNYFDHLFYLWWTQTDKQKAVKSGGGDHSNLVDCLKFTTAVTEGV